MHPHKSLASGSSHWVSSAPSAGSSCPYIPVFLGLSFSLTLITPAWVLSGFSSS